MNEISDDQLRLVARLYYQDQLDQNQIAEILLLSRSQISRMLTRAREKGIVRISVEEFSPRCPALEEQLKALLPLKNAFVIRVSDSNPERVRKTVGYFGASILARLIRPNSLLGVAGGRSLMEVAHQLSPEDEVRGVDILQLMGNLSPVVHSTDSFELCHHLARKFGGELYSLNAPIYVDDAAARQSFLQHEHMRMLWQLYEKMQMAIVGIGSLDDSFFIERHILPSSDLARLQDSNVIGETCGRFYDAQGQECCPFFRDRVISVELKTLQHTPEVIGVTSGTRKIEAISPAVRSGLIKSLLTDEATAAALIAYENTHHPVATFLGGSLVKNG